MISTRTHGILDYLVGLLLIAAPWLLGFSDVGGAAVWVPVVLGILLLGTSLITRYELSVAKIVPMPVHLWLDSGQGAFLAVSPWLFGFADDIWSPHVVVGLAEIAVAAMTERHSPQERQAPDRLPRPSPRATEAHSPTEKST